MLKTSTVTGEPKHRNQGELEGRIGRHGKLWRLCLFWACVLLIGCPDERRCPEFRFMDQCTKAGARWEDCEESAMVQGLMVPCDGTRP